MENMTLQQLVTSTQEALAESYASSYYQKVFKTVTRQFLLYAKEKGIGSFSIDAGLRFLEDHYFMTRKIEEKKWAAIYLRCINALSEYRQSGSVSLYPAMGRRDYSFPEGFKAGADGYLSYRKKTGIADKSIKISSLYLERFFAFLQKGGISGPGDIALKDVFGFMESLSCYEKSTVNHTMRTVRYYLKYCYENGLTGTDMFSKLPNPYYNRQSRIPSSYSTEEVSALLESIDLGNPCGLRDYAIILLIARLGLRSSDVAGLAFSNIDRENDMIRLSQVKTGNPLELPLLEDVGRAIINYLKNARPKTDDSHVFVKQAPPYTGFKPGCVGKLVRSRLQKSGIYLEGRKKGSHALRHSLARRLLEHEVPLPVISEIPGHADTETTMAYLRIDTAGLKKCALEVDV